MVGGDEYCLVEEVAGFNGVVEFVRYICGPGVLACSRKAVCLAHALEKSRIVDPDDHAGAAQAPIPHDCATLCPIFGTREVFDEIWLNPAPGPVCDEAVFPIDLGSDPLDNVRTLLTLMSIADKIASTGQGGC